jgi:heme-degrading monooxygenase HmoA
VESRFQPPYYAVIFISSLSEKTDGYAEAADRMVELAQTMPGFLGVESAREERGISVSFWKDEASIENWKQQAEHLAAQQRGTQQWYSHYELHVARVERYHSHSQDKS